MLVIEGENTVYCDVDDTLLLWFSKCDPEEKIQVICPYGGSETWLKPHKRHIELLKKYHGRGMTVVVWSAAGVKWAEAAVKALGLESFVDICITKPTKYIDDLGPTEILGTHIFLEDKDEVK